MIRVRKLQQRPELKPFKSMFGRGYLTEQARRRKNEWWGAFDGPNLVGIAAYHTGDREVSVVAVLPEARGQGLMGKFLDAIHTYAGAGPTYTYASKDNVYSIQNLILAGYRLTGTDVDYAHFRRVP